MATQCLPRIKGCSFKIPYTVGIPNSDLCVLLGNLLKNALEACLRHKSDDSFIKLNARPVGSKMLVITVANGYVEKPRAILNGFVSAKRDSIGTGAYSVRRIAQSHNGEALFEWKDGVFYASITMKY